jgi:hypothetical protein
VQQEHPYFKTRFAVSTPRATIIKVTPELADELLKTSIGNRRIRDYWVDYLAGCMTRDEIRVTSQGIGVDVDGHLRDGHHRLLACVKSGVPFTTVAVYGIPADAYQVIDIGVKRSMADLLDDTKPVAEVLRLATVYAISNQKPSAAQVRQWTDGRLREIVQDLMVACPTHRRYYSAAPMKLAASISILAGCDADFVIGQYRALVNFDINAMTQASRALVRQVENGSVRSIHTEDTLARGLRVFDKERSDLARIQINETHASEATRFVAAIMNAQRRMMEGCAA